MYLENASTIDSRPVRVGSCGKTLLIRSALSLLICAIAVAICYFFVDRPVAYWVREQGWSHYRFLIWLQDPPPILQTWAPVVLTALMVRRAWGPFRRWEMTLLAACVSLLVAVQFKDGLKYCFGRYWPDTWIHNNPSLLKDGAYGFHPFHDGPAYGSFPSGHMTRTLAILAVVWLANPRWRGACIVATAAVAIGLIGMDYHFVGDVIAGGCVGSIVGAYTAHGLALAAEPIASNKPVNP